MFVSVLLYGWTTWMLTKRIEKKAKRKLHKNTTSNIEQHLEGTARKTRAVRPHTFHLEKQGSNLQVTFYERDSISRQARTYLLQLCEDIGCSLEDLPGTMDDRDWWRERERERERESQGNPSLRRIPRHFPAIHPDHPLFISLQVIWAASCVCAELIYIYIYIYGLHPVSMCIYIYMCVCVCICIYTYIYMCVCLCVCVYIYVCVCVCIYIYI